MTQDKALLSFIASECLTLNIMVDIFKDKQMFPMRGVVIPCLGLHPDHDKAFSS